MITTDRQIQSLKPGERVYWQSVRSPHGGGLAIRVSTRGTRSWYVRYRHDGRQDAICIGHYPGMKLQAARDRHYEIRQLVADNLDPKRIQRQQKAANLEAWSMDQLFESYGDFWCTGGGRKGGVSC
ncbi:Putative prophage CPS-53 integrase [Halomonas sp. THAF12]|nr:Putative prophage CPS-53 integrase [Halomonas sp. THAF12]